MDEALTIENNNILNQREMDDDLPGKNNDKLIGERQMTTDLVITTS